VGPDNTLTLRNVQRSHEDNYSCHAKNSLGTDEITYTLQIQGRSRKGTRVGIMDAHAVVTCFIINLRRRDPGIVS